MQSIAKELNDDIKRAHQRRHESRHARRGNRETRRHSPAARRDQAERKSMSASSSDDAGIVAVIDKMLKQRTDSIAQYEAAKRTDLADAEKFEATLLAAYLPAGLSEAEISAARRRRTRRIRRQGARRHGQGHGPAETASGRPRRHDRSVEAGQNRPRGALSFRLCGDVSAHRGPVIPESFIQELLHRIDVVDLIDSYVPLKKAGANSRPAAPSITKNRPHSPSARASSSTTASAAAPTAPPSAS